MSVLGDDVAERQLGTGEPLLCFGLRFRLDGFQLGEGAPACLHRSFACEHCADSLIVRDGRARTRLGRDDSLRRRSHHEGNHQKAVRHRLINGPTGIPNHQKAKEGNRLETG